MDVNEVTGGMKTPNLRHSRAGGPDGRQFRTACFDGERRTTRTQWRPFVRSFKTESCRVTQNCGLRRPMNAQTCFRVVPLDPVCRGGRKHTKVEFVQTHQTERQPVPERRRRSEIGPEAQFEVITHPANIPPASTRKTLTTI